MYTFFFEKFSFYFRWLAQRLYRSRFKRFLSCLCACICVCVCLHSPFSIVYSPPLSPPSSIFLQKEHGCALRSDLASTEIKSAGINTAYKWKAQFSFDAIFHDMNTHRSFPWIFQSLDIPNFSFFLRMIFKKFNSSRYIQSCDLLWKEVFLRTEKWFSDIVWIDKYRFDSNRIRKFDA